MRIPIPWAMQAYKSKSMPLSSQELINLYLEKEIQSAKEPVALFRRPGLTLFGSAGVTKES